MQVISCFFNEVVPQIFFGFLNTIFLSLIFDFITHIFLLILIEQSRNHTNSQQIIDQLQETFLDDMSISE